MDLDKLAARVRNLNQQFFQWVQSQHDDHISELWTAGVKEYITFAEELEAEYSKGGGDGAVPNDKGTINFLNPIFASTSPEPAGGLAAGLATAAGHASVSPGSASQSMFGAVTSSTAEPTSATPAPPSFPAPPNVFGGAFTFGKPTAATSAENSPAQPFSFSSATTVGTASSPVVSAAQTFSFPAPSSSGNPSFAPGFPPAAFAQPGAGASQASQDDGVDDEPKKFESEVKVDGDKFDILFQSKSKFYYFKSGGWESGGLGLLTVRKVKGQEGAKPYVVMTTEAGKVLLTASFAPKANIRSLKEQPKSVTASFIAKHPGAEEMQLSPLRFSLPNVDVAQQFETLIRAQEAK